MTEQLKQETAILMALFKSTVEQSQYLTGELKQRPSEVYSPVSLGRKAIGIELKDSYFKQAKINLSLAENRFKEEVKQEALFNE